MRKIFSLVPLAIVVVAAAWAYDDSLRQSTYLGLPATPCIDGTKPLLQNYSFSVAITIKGTDYPLYSQIGHDPGTCLRSIYTNSSSGEVWVQSNELENYTLGDFFDTWRVGFDSQHVMNYWVSANDSLIVKVNGNPVPTYDRTVLRPNESVEIIYQ